MARGHALAAAGRIRKAGVIGAGVMGAQIAGWLASQGIVCELLDLASPEGPRSRLAEEGRRRLSSLKPPPLASPSAAERIRPGNVEDHLDRLGDVDWVIEAVVEDLRVKQDLWARLEPHIAPRAVISTNTSGLSVREQVQGRSEDFRRRFLGIHFFNPPRYLRLVEVIPLPETEPEIVEGMRAFLRRHLGKVPVMAKDTPNFIGNRVGVYALQAALEAMAELGLSVEAVDTITGPAMGRPRSATFRTLDLVGLDTYLHVLRTGESRATDPQERALLRPPEAIVRMVERGLLGEKSGAGFYRRVEKDGSREIEVIDLNTLEYRPRQEVRFESVDRAMAAPPQRRLEVLLQGQDAAARFAWRTLRKVLRFCAAGLGEFADRCDAVDAAMRWGFSWEWGPFEIWDLLGVRAVAQRMLRDGLTLPPIVEQLLEQPEPAFYRTQPGPVPVRLALDASGVHRPVETVPEHLPLPVLKASRPAVATNPSAALLDGGDGVAVLEFCAPKAAIDEPFIEMVEKAVSELGWRWRGLVIVNDGPDFSLGANLFHLLVAARQGAWSQLEQVVRRFQQLNLSLKYAPAPVAVALAGRVLGGGAEMAMHAACAVAAVETYMGLVETGVGLIPAGGGTKEMLARTLSRLPEGRELDPQGLVAWAFEVVGRATVSQSAYEARELGLLRPWDPVIADREALLYHACRHVAHLDSLGFRPPAPRALPAPGRDVRAALVAGLLDLRRANRITDHDVVVGRALAHVLCGGDVPGGTPVEESRLLDLEREAFLSLLGHARTQQRIEHVLTTGRPLRN